MPPFLFPWMAGWCLYWSFWLPPAPKQAEVVELAAWRQRKGAGRG